MTLTHGQFEELHKQLMSSGPEGEGGFSVNVGTGAQVNPGDSAFVVSRPGAERTVPQAIVSPSDLSDFAETHKKRLSGSDDLMGGWKPPVHEDPDVYLDHSQALRYTSQHPNPRRDVAHADTLTSAMDLAHARNQISVYNAREDKVVDNPSYKAPKRK